MTGVPTAEMWSDLLHKLFVRRSSHGLVQLFRYLFVGGFSAAVDLGTLVAATEIAGISYLASAALAFVLGTVVNYLLSVLWVFRSSGRFRTEFILFTLIGMGGLGLNELIIWVMVETVGVHYVTGKLVSLSIVVIWSFTLRRLLFNRLAARLTHVGASVPPGSPSRDERASGTSEGSPHIPRPHV